MGPRLTAVVPTIVHIQTYQGNSTLWGPQWPYQGPFLLPKDDRQGRHDFSEARFMTRWNLTATGPCLMTVDPTIVHIQTCQEKSTLCGPLWTYQGPFLPLKMTGGAKRFFRSMCWDQMEPNCNGSSLNGRGLHNLPYKDLLGQEHLVGTSVDLLGSILPPKNERRGHLRPAETN